MFSTVICNFLWFFLINILLLQDCKILVPELKQKIDALKQEKLYLEAQKGFLHVQLENSLNLSSKLEADVTDQRNLSSNLEADITGLKYELRNKDLENQELRSRLTKLEVLLRTDVSWNNRHASSEFCYQTHNMNFCKIIQVKIITSRLLTLLSNLWWVTSPLLLFVGHICQISEQKTKY